jgi:hypothetical protein
LDKWTTLGKIGSGILVLLGVIFAAAALWPQEERNCLLVNMRLLASTYCPTSTPTSDTRPTHTLILPHNPEFIIGDADVPLRNAPIPTTASIVDYARNIRLTILGVSANGSYYQVEYNDQTLWVSRDWGHVEGDMNVIPVVAPTATEPVTVTFIIGDADVPLRNAPIPTTASIVDYARNIRLTILGVSANGSYYQVEYNDQTLWVSRDWGRVEGNINIIRVVEPSS